LRRTPPRLLVVDDDDSVASIIRQYFTTAGYRVEVAQHGGDALTLIEHDPPDVVLLDITMPGMGGMEVLQRILALHRGLPVIVVTARADVALAEQTRALGAFEYVTKPFEFSYLERVVNRALTSAGEGADGAE
jgi:two-component system OmpR family response regulator